MVVTIFTGNSLPILSKAFLKSIKLIYKEDCHSKLCSMFLFQLLVQCHLDALQDHSAEHFICTMMPRQS